MVMRLKLPCLFLLVGLIISVRAEPEDLRKALTLHCSFDTDAKGANFALGNAKIFYAPSAKQFNAAKEGFPEGVEVVRTGKFGTGLAFRKKINDVVFFHAARNIDYQAKNFDGTVSVWLSVTPDEDLAPGYTDPIQITSKQWDDAAFFVEFTKDEKPREFRLGAYADKKVWNPSNKPWGDIPLAEKPLVRVVRPPFKREDWTHVVFAFSNYNSGKADGVTKLYLNGELQGQLSPREQTFTWDLNEAKIMIGLSYVGLMDELSVFDRELSAAEVKELHGLSGGVKAFLK